MQAIENQKGVVATKEQDFAIKQDVFMRVQAADAKIAEHRENIANHLNPALITATNNYNDYLPIYEAKKQEYTARIDSLTTMSGFDLTKATNAEGITQLATELKTQAEQGFETIINEPVSYYEDYVRNYIRAKGDLEYSKKYAKDFDCYGCSTSKDDENPLIKKGYTWHDRVGNLVPHVISGTTMNRVDGITVTSENGSSKYFGLSELNNGVVSLTQAEYDQVINKLEQNIPAVYQWLEDAKVIGAQTDSELAKAKQMVVKAVERAKLLAAVKFYQGEYERLGGSSTAEGLQALRTKIQKTNEFNQTTAELKNENLLNTVFTSFQAWKKENITDVENMNTKFVNDFKANLTKMLAAEQKNHDDLLGLKNKAQQAVDEINRQIAQLEPSRADRETAAQAEPAHQELLAQRAELERLINELTLNDLKNIGANAVAIGTARATGANATAIGFQSNATNINAIALGTDSLASKVDSIAIGTAAKSTGDESIAIGKNTHVSGDKSIAIGVGHTVSGNRSTTIGDPNVISGDDVFVAGNNNSVASNNVMVMGNNITVSTGFDGAVVLGANSTVAAANPTSSIEIQGNTYNFAGTTPTSTVSVGKAGEERQITNVAAGRISETSTDAINGSQLYAVTEALNAIQTINLDDIADDINNAKTTVTAGQGISITENDNVNGSKNYTASAKLGEGLSFDENGAIRANGTTLRAGDNVEITGDASSGYTISSKTQIINGGKATVVHAGDNVRVTGDVDNGFTVNVDNMRTTVTGGQGAEVTSSDNTDGSKNYTVNVKVGEGLTYDDKGNLVNDMKLTAGENVQVSGDAKGGYTISATDTNTQATVSADKGITVTETNNANGTKNYAVSAKLGKGLKVDENGAIAATAQPINGGAGVSITTNAQDEAVVNVAGVTTTTDDGKSYTRSDLTKPVGVKGDGKNIRTSTAANGDVQVKLADDIQVNSVAIHNGPTINQQGINANTTRITNVQDGVAPTDAVNVRQLNQQGNIINQRIDNLADHVKKNKKRTDAGIASTAAMTNIPQVLLAGQFGIGVGIGHRDGQSAIAVGYSRASENAKHSVKFSVGMDTQSKATLGAGYMYNW